MYLVKYSLSVLRKNKGEGGWEGLALPTIEISPPPKLDRLSSGAVLRYDKRRASHQHRMDYNRSATVQHAVVDGLRWNHRQLRGRGDP